MPDEINTTLETTSQESTDDNQNTESDQPANFWDQHVTDDLKKDFGDDFEKIYNQLAKDPTAALKDSLHKTKHFGKVKEEVRIELEKELGKKEEFKAEDYTYEKPEYEVNEDIINTVKDKAVELGIKPEAFKALVQTFFTKEGEALKALQAEQQASQNEMQDSLKEQWGDKYEERLEKANKTWNALMPEGDDKLMSELPENAKLAISKIMDNISGKISEGFIGKGGGGNKGLDKLQALNKIQEIRNDLNSPFNKGDFRAQEEMTKLYSEAYPAGDSTNKVSSKTLDLSKLLNQ